MKMELNMMNMLHMLKTGRRERRPVALITTENSNACVHQKRLVHANSTSRQISCWRYAVYSISSRAALARLTKRYCRRVTNVPWPGGSHMSSILVPGNSVRDSAGRRCDERTDARAVVQPVPTCRFNQQFRYSISAETLAEQSVVRSDGITSQQRSARVVQCWKFGVGWRWVAPFNTGGDHGAQCTS